MSIGDVCDGVVPAAEPAIEGFLVSKASWGSDRLFPELCEGDESFPPGCPFVKLKCIPFLKILNLLLPLLIEVLFLSLMSVMVQKGS